MTAPASIGELDLLASLDIEVLEVANDNALTLQDSDSGWFERICPTRGQRIDLSDLSDACPYLENFLIDCLDFWDTGATRLHSGSWIQRDATGTECALDAWAVQTGAHRFLLVRLLGEEFEERRAALQAVRDSRLSNEKLGYDNRLLTRINELKSEFLASMSHELRTPLTAILGFSNLLADGTAGPLNAEQSRFVQHVVNASHHLLGLINDVLDLSKMEAGHMILNREAFAFATVLREVLATIRPLAQVKQIELVAEGDLDADIYADRVRAKQILYNLLSNAIKFTPNTGCVSVQAAVLPPSLEISVSDTGIGIPIEEQDAIFEKFHQVGAHSSQGTGLGLAITRRLVEQHGGSISVNSVPGQGSRFTFTLALAER
jgi:signal transduction histidine kinase